MEDGERQGEEGLGETCVHFSLETLRKNLCFQSESNLFHARDATKASSVPMHSSLCCGRVFPLLLKKTSQHQDP